MSDIRDRTVESLARSARADLRPPTIGQIETRKRSIQRRRQVRFASVMALGLIAGVTGLAMSGRSVDEVQTADAPPASSTRDEAAVIVQQEEPAPETQEELDAGVAEVIPGTPIEVPALVDLLVDDAVSQVEAIGLVAEITYIDSEAGNPEHVIRTDPAAGTLIDPESTVILVVPAPVEEPTDPEEAAFLRLEELVTRESELFVGYYIGDDGIVTIATSPDFDSSEVEVMVRGEFDRPFRVDTCSRSSAELKTILAEVMDMARRMNVEGPTASGIDASTCTVTFRASLSSEQEAELISTFGDAVTIEADFNAWERIPTEE